MRNNKYDLRGNNILSLPKVNTKKHGLNSFKYFAVKQWNNIPNELCLKSGGSEFNTQYPTHGTLNFSYLNFVILDTRYFIHVLTFLCINFFLF